MLTTLFAAAAVYVLASAFFIEPETTSGHE